MIMNDMGWMFVVVPGLIWGASFLFIAEGLHAAVLVPIENLVARLPRDPELGAEGRHLLALEQAGDKPEPLVHDVTLLPRHAPSCEGAKVSPMCPEYGVTYLSGRTHNNLPTTNLSSDLHVALFEARFARVSCYG